MIIYQVVDAKNGDEYTMHICADLASARRAAENEYYHLTKRERLAHQIRIEGYSAPEYITDIRTALDDIAEANDNNPGCLPDPVFFEEFKPL